MKLNIPGLKVPWRDYSSERFALEGLRIMLRCKKI